MWVKTNRLIKWIFSGFVWDIPNKKTTVYLTFDDGPIPGITEFVLDEMKHHNIKATFFCIGKNIEAHPDLFRRIVAEGHSVGNHTNNHLKGWNTSTEKYLDNSLLCKNKIEEISPNQPLLFRPPYGKIKFSQASKIKKLGYKIIMWDVLSVDFDPNITSEKCLQNVIENTVSGSIIVFHDSIKAAENLKFALPKAIESLQKKGFNFDKIN